MLTIPTFVDRSKISGLGLFTKSNISKGEVVWIYHPSIDFTFTKEQWQLLEKDITPYSFESVKRYSYKENGSYILCADNAQFMNHSETQFNVENSSDLKTMLAFRDIHKGEELLCNYFEYSDPDDHHLEHI